MSLRFTSKKTRGKFFYRMFRFFLIIISLIFIISYFSYYKIKESIKNEISYYNTAAVNSIANSVNVEFDEIEKEFVLFPVELDGTYYLNEKVNYEDIIKKEFNSLQSINKRLGVMQNVKSSIYGIAIHFNVNDFIVSTYGTYTFDEYFDKYNLYEHVDKEFLRTIHENNKYVNFLKPCELKKPYHGVTSIQVVPVVFCYPNFRSMKMSILTNIKVSYLQKLLTDNKTSDGTVLCMVDNEFGIISSTDEEFFKANKDFLLQVKGQINGSIVKLGNKNSVVFSQDIKYTGWKVYSFVPLNEFLEKPHYILKSLVLINIILLVFGLFMSFAFSSRLYSPIANLINLLQTDKKQEKGILNEIEYITDKLKMLKNTNRDLAGRMSKIGPYVQENIIKNVVMYGDYSLDEQEILELFNEEKVKLDRKYFILAIYRLVYNTDFARDFNDEDRERVKVGIPKVIKESVHHRFEDTLCVDLGEGSFFMVTNSDDQDLRGQYCKVMELVNDIFTEDARYLRMLVYVGRQVDGIQMLPEEFMTGKTVMEHSDLDRAGYILPLEADIKISEVFMPTNLEEKLSNVICSCNFEIVRQFMEEVFEKSFRNCRTAVGLKRLSAVLMEIYEKTTEKYKLNMNDLTSEEMEKATEAWDFQRVKDIYTDLFYSIAGHIKGESSDEEKKRFFKEYFDENYMNENINLDFMADETGFHKNYISKLFKDVMGQTFTDYISTLRMEKAKKLLEETDLTIDLIAQQVGISSRTTFNRLFKRNASVSPATYRLIKRDTSASPTD